MMRTVLVVDDKELMRDSVATTLRRAGLNVVTAADGHAALEAIAQRRPDVVVTDQKMPGMGGVELLEQIRRIDDELPVILMTAFGSIETAVKAMRQGAFDYLTKPFEGDELVIAAKRAIEHARLLRDNAVLRIEAARHGGGASDNEGTGLAGDNGSATDVACHDGRAGSACVRGADRLIGGSPAMRRLRDQVRALAASQGTVLICGESGSGKEVVARAVHDESTRAGAPFLAVNCAALSESLLESELFGHERGAFTGAERLRKGRFELADGGTLLLDEVSEVPPQIQAKLLRVLQERAFERVGSSITIGIDVRVVATSNRDLPESVAAGQFRQDLYFRLNVLPLRVPALRERLEDVPELARHFAGQICGREGRPPVAFDSGAIELMLNYPWPGNVRELQNICERAVVLCGGAAGRNERGERVVTRDLIEPWLHAPTTSAAPGGMVWGFIEAKTAGHMRSDDGVHDGLHNGANGVHAGTNGAHVGTNGVHGEASAGAPASSRKTLEEIERAAIVEALHRFNGHRQRTASALGIGVRTLGLKLKKWKQLQLVEPTL